MSEAKRESAAIEVEGLTKSFGGVKAVANVSFSVRSGSLVTILGPSGCGKTTVLRCIAGVEEPEAGEIRIAGETVYSLEKKISVPPEKRGIGMVYQSYALWPHMTVFGNIAYPLQIRHDQAVERKVEATLQQLGIANLRDRLPLSLSGGEQQRVALGRSLVYNPHVLLLDEPLSSLDAPLRESLREELRMLQKESGITMLYVTHDRSEALALSDRLVLISQGKIMAEGAADEMMTSPPNSYAAAFLSGMLVLDGKIVRSGEEVVAKTELGNFRLSTPPRGEEERVKLCIRPISLGLRRQESPTARTVGTVVGVVHKEDTRVEYRVAVGNHVVKINADSDETWRPSVSEKVFIEIPESSYIVLRD